MNILDIIVNRYVMWREHRMVRRYLKSSGWKEIAGWWYDTTGECRWALSMYEAKREALLRSI